MHLAIDARLLAYRRGMGHFVHSLVHQWAHIAPDHRFTLYTDSPQTRDSAPRAPNITVRELSPRLYPLWEQIALPRAAKRDHADVLYCPANTAPLQLDSHIKLVVTIHDVMYLLPRDQLPTSPSPYQQLGRLYRQWNVPRAAQRANAIITDSRYSADDIRRHVRPTPQNIHVIYGAPASGYEVQSITDVARVIAHHQLAPKFIIALGAIDPRKNTDRVIAAFAQFVNRAPANTEHQLVMVGTNATVRERVTQLAAQFNLSECQLKLLDFVSEPDLAALYTATAMLVYPSLYEGFGLPPLEAMACGAPVITSNVTSLPEVVGDAALLVDPRDTDAIADAIHTLANDSALQDTLRARGKQRAAQFNWRTSAQQMLTLLTSIAAS